MGTGVDVRADDAGLTVAPLTGRPGLRLAGEIDAANRASLASALEELMGSAGDVHLDLAGVDFLDVGAAHLIAATARRLAPGRLVLVHPPRELTFMLDTLWPGAGIGVD